VDLTWVIVIIVLVLGVIVSNITLLKYSAKFKFPTPLPKDKNGKEKNDEVNSAEQTEDSTKPKDRRRNGFDDEEDDW